MSNFFACEKCGSDTRGMGQMVISIPSSMMYSLTKKNMTSKDFKIHGVLWETFDHICTNENCRHVTNGYGNYVTRLQKENEELRKKLEALK